MKHGNLVLRKSYGGDIVFRIEHIVSEYAILKGINFRLLADSPLRDLEVVTGQGIAQARKADPQTDKLVKMMLREQQSERNQLYFNLPGKILHLDGDAMYLKKCMEIYETLQIPASGYHIPEADMAEALRQLLSRVRPDILVITGHDGILKDRGREDLYSLSSYKNSAHFVQAVRVAREYERSRDELIIVGGACQSHFEAILQAGANFASSPDRVLIHALDPLYAAVRAAYTPVREMIDIGSVIHHTSSGIRGMGGVETKGCFRKGLPNLQVSVNAAKLS